MANFLCKVYISGSIINWLDNNKSVITNDGGLRVFEMYHLCRYASLLYCEQLDRNNNSELILL